VTNPICLRYAHGTEFCCNLMKKDSAMDGAAPARPLLRLVAIAWAATMLGCVLAPAAIAQTTAPTLTAPKAPLKSSRTAPAKTAPIARINPCSIYGAGFVNLPGTDTCVKAGGYVRSDAAVNLRR
jgi:hypothetical protein